MDVDAANGDKKTLKKILGEVVEVMKSVPGWILEADGEPLMGRQVVFKGPVGEVARIGGYDILRGSESK